MNRSLSLFETRSENGCIITVVICGLDGAPITNQQLADMLTEYVTILDEKNEELAN